ncbi:MAG TPA: serine/threonine-protein kinase [Streptosporangiaceae bacterium]|nr:serine/threonine-protein kinase [Streptosporangiaceae bacterium]
MHAVMGTGRLIAGRYRLQGPLGRGAMGIVWRGRDELLHRDVAVKQVQIPALTPAAEAEAIYQRTLREARTAARLSHPGVVTIFDVVEEDSSPWIVMELIAGRSLDQVIAEDGPLPPPHAATLGASLLGALATAHAAGVLHRDVKPGNVLVTAEGRAVLTDFGIATFAGDPALTQVGMVVGTPGFTAPERIRGDSATPASDLWSLGATLYAAVEGRGPFDRPGGATAIITAVAAEDAPRAPSAGPLSPVIDALLRSDPGTRPDAATAETMLIQASAGTQRPGAAGHPAGTTGLGDPAAGADPPGYAGLAMPGPAGRDSAPAGARQPWSRHWRVATVTTGIAAIVVAAVLGSEIYSRSLSGGTDASQAGPAAGVHGAAAAGGAAGPSAGAAPGSAGPAGASTRPGSAAGGSGAASSPAAAGPGTAPPAGYRWRTVTAARAGVTAGFVMAVPDGWHQRIRGHAAFFRAPGSAARIEVSMSPFAYHQPGRQAHAEQAHAIAAHQYPGYVRGGIRAATFQGAPAATWRYSWKPAGGARTAVLSLLVTLPTRAGPQSYALTVSSPAGPLAAARAAYGQALATFRSRPPS